MNSQGNYRELVPELYSLPEIRMNLNKFPLGSRPERQIDDMILPPWAHSAIELVYLHRKALESEFVSRGLNNWIDLIWGYKQRGEQVELANNVFQRELYPDVSDATDLGNSRQ
jgi:hypothetical protein